MKWISIKERLPEKDGWYLWWDGNYYTELYYIVGRPFGHLYTHWLKITGPEDADKPEQYLEVLSETKELLERVVNSGLLSVCDCRRFNSVIQKIETISTARTAGGLLRR